MKTVRVVVVAALVAALLGAAVAFGSSASSASARPTERVGTVQDSRSAAADDGWGKAVLQGGAAMRAAAAGVVAAIGLVLVVASFLPEPQPRAQRRQARVSDDQPRRDR